MPDNLLTSNKRIAKNALMLYIRIFFTMIVTLYTSRVLLVALGASDYGLNNVVAGLVSLFLFVNASLSNGTSRFMQFAIGKNDNSKLIKTFSCAFWIHAALAAIIVIALESGGLWFLLHKMTIPDGRENAALWLFHFSVIMCALNITQVPYQATIISHERFNIFAYLGILDAVLKLAIAFAVKIYGGDKLILYGLLLTLVQAFILVLYRLYCARNFEEAKIKFLFDKEIGKKLLSFSGWNIIGSMAFAMNGQGINVLFNIFLGTIVNAARAISMQVNSVVNQFVNNVQTAITPQIIKCYAAKEYKAMHGLMCNNCLLVGALILCVICPIVLNVDFILDLWLGKGNVPQYTGVFTQLILLTNLIICQSRPFIIGIHAVGEMKNYSLIAGTALLAIVPISYLLLKCDCSPVVVYVVGFAPWLFEQVYSVIYMKNKIGFGGLDVFYNVILRIYLVAAISISLTHYIVGSLCSGWTRLLLSSICVEVMVGGLIYLFVLNKSLRRAVNGYILKLVRING